MTIRKLAVLLVLIVLGIASVANAQYFGRNKVQYEQFDFRVLTTGHFDIYYYPEGEAAVQFFGDAGAAWASDGKPQLLGGDRLNAFGCAIAEVDYVRPLDRPGRGWLWQFNLTPGF